MSITEHRFLKAKSGYDDEISETRFEFSRVGFSFVFFEIYDLRDLREKFKNPVSRLKILVLLQS